MFSLTELSRLRHTAWLGGEGGSKRGSEALAGEKAIGICMLRVSGLSPTEDTETGTLDPTRNTWQDLPSFLHVMHQSWMSVLQGLAIQESCHASCILHVCHMQGQSTLHCKMDGRMDARTMPCILHSACMSHARTVHPPLQDGWTDGCKNHAMHLAFCMYVTCKDSPPSIARWMDGWMQEPCHASCILHVCHMQGQSTLHCKMDGRMDARTMPCILHSACMSHARTVHPPLQDGWTDGCKNHAMHLAFCMYVTCKDSPPSIARWMDGWMQEPCHASCILHVCHMQGQSTLHCKMDGRMDARTMPCILHSACMSHARTVHPPLQDGWTDGCKNRAMHLAFYMYVPCKDNLYTHSMALLLGEACCH